MANGDKEIFLHNNDSMCRVGVTLYATKRPTQGTTLRVVHQRIGNEYVATDILPGRDFISP